MGNIINNNQLSMDQRSSLSNESKNKQQQTTKKQPKFQVNQEELRARLTPIQYSVTQEKATERAYTGEYTDHHEPGKYLCVVCENELFKSDSKFESACGWPAFRAPVSDANVDCTDDYSANMIRTEVTCSNCGAHLGHVFDDGPLPARTRYCINSASLKFLKRIPK